jgi:predicted RNA-binding Zn ribbon-like protein
MGIRGYARYILGVEAKGVNVLFAHDTEVALQAAAALVNTDSRSGDQLPDPAALDAFADTWGWTGTRRRTRQELEEVRALRSRLRRLWQLDEDALVDEVNTMLREAQALPQLVRHDEWDYHLHATPPQAPLAERMAVEAAMAMIDVVRQRELDRLQVCDAPDCDDVLIDLSKNRSRRYCGSACLNRVNVAAFRARHRGE